MTNADYMRFIEESRVMEKLNKLNYLAKKFPFGPLHAPFFGIEDIVREGMGIRIDNKVIKPYDKGVTLPPKSHAFNYPVNFFEGLLCFRREGELFVFRLQDHLQRIHNTATTKNTPVPSIEEMADFVKEVIRANSECIPSIIENVGTYVRPNIFSDVVSLETGPINQCKFTVELSPYFIPPFEMMPLSNLYIFPYPRDQLQVDASLKMGKHYEQPFLNNRDNTIAHPIYIKDGEVTETDRANLAFVCQKDGRAIIYMPDSEWIVPSITKETLYSLFKDEYTIVRNRPVTLDDLTNGSINGVEITEIFSMATAVSVTGVGKIYSSNDNRGDVTPNYDNPIWQSGGNNSITRGFYEKLIGFYKGEIPDNNNWLERIVLIKKGK